MPQPRHQLSSAQIDDLSKRLDTLVESLDLRTQPAVVAKILELNASASAGFADYARVIRTDPTLSGRLFKIVNSAYYAQRAPVTNLDRACVLLGLERLKSFSLGFYLSSAAADRESEFSRTIWGASVYRACLASELARESCPTLVIEAFVVGLMLDAGLGIMPRLLGTEYAAIIDANLPPADLYDREFYQLEFTHVDVVSSLLRRWRLPLTLATPIDRHHIAPAKTDTPDTIGKLHRIAYVVGQTDCRAAISPEETIPVVPAGSQDLLGISDERIDAAIGRAATEYKAAIDLFSDVASHITDLNTLSARIREQLADSLHTALECGERAAKHAVERFLSGDTLLEACEQTPGAWIAYLCDGSGSHLAQVTFQLAHADIRSIRESLGLSSEDDHLIRTMVVQLARRAA